MERELRRALASLGHLFPCLRVSMVASLLECGMIDRAVESALPLVGTEHSAWFLYTRAWQYLSAGDRAKADELLLQAQSLYSDPSSSGSSYPVQRLLDLYVGKGCTFPGFRFGPDGRPDPSCAFHDAAPDIEDEIWSFSNALYNEDAVELQADIQQNIRLYKDAFKSIVLAVENVLHHEAETIGTAVQAAKLHDEGSPFGSNLLGLILMTFDHLQLVADTLWKVGADWDDNLSILELTSFFYYLLEDDELALDQANQGLKKNEASLICGNVRALVLNGQEKVYMADEQWRKTLSLRPNKSATYLVLGHQALCSGGLDAALRYFQEAVVIGDNPEEATRFLSAALDCLKD